MGTLSFLVLGLLSLWLGGAWAASSVCRFSNVQGNVRTFFTSNRLVTTFPCSYRLADIRCGKAKTVVTMDNAKNKNGTLYVQSVTVNITIITYGNTIRQTNTLSLQDYNRYLRRAKWDKPMWIWALEEGAPEKDDRILGYYDRKREVAYVTYGDLKVEWSVEADSLSVICTNDALRTAVKFPKTICGSPENKDADLTKVDGSLPHAKTTDLTLTRLDYVQLALQDVEQTKPACVDASNLLTDRCKDKGDQLYKCHQMYSPFEKRLYGKCMVKNGIDAFRVYTSCVRILCGKRNVILTPLECRLLNQVKEKCGDIKQSPVLVSELLDKAVCGLPKMYWPTTTTTKAPAPAPAPAPPPAYAGW